MELIVYNKAGEDTGKKIELNEEIFGIEPNDHAIYLDVKQFMANNRQGTHKTKERNEIAGSTKKIKRQKGTGGARAGSIKSPLFPGGGRVFGPQPKVYNFKLNKKVKQLARKSALAYKARENSIIVVEDFNLEMPKTQEFNQLRSNLKINDKKSLFVIPVSDKNLYLSSRNIQNTKISTATDINTYDILNSNTVVMLESSVGIIENAFKI
ncbi:MAG: 50S ribosomal protein L4 [Bacteroidia bacterium]|nr:50S ribosomal protein L4 [Bacteroidia bacterium]